MNKLRVLAIAIVAVFASLDTYAQKPVTPAIGVPAHVDTTIQGNALTPTNGPLADATVRLRNARTGRIVETTITDKSGLFTFRSVDPGSYIVELLGRDRAILAASDILHVNGGEVATAIVKLPFRIPPFAGVLGHSTAQAVIVTATAAASGVLATQVTGDPVSPRQ